MFKKIPIFAIKKNPTTSACCFTPNSRRIRPLLGIPLVLNSLDSDQAQHFVEPDLGPGL